MIKTNKPFISIILPCKNEEENITRCLTSVVKAVKDIDQAEIMVVDAASRDKTIERAMQFPVNIIQLESSWIHTSSAGRYLGSLNTNGKYIFIIDADMELVSGFLEKALEYMEKDKYIAGVAGLGKEVYIEQDKIVGLTENVYKRNATKVAEADYLGAAALFRREALEDAGHFNPYLYSQEELELCQRLRKKEWKVLSLPYPMIIHYTYPPKGMKVFKKQLVSGRFTGIGQIMRLSLKTGVFWSNLFRFKKFFFFLIAVISMIAILFFSLIRKNTILLSLEAIIISLFYLYLVIRKGRLKEAALTSIKWLCIVSMVLKGFLKRPRHPEDYPKDVKIVRKLQ